MHLRSNMAMKFFALILFVGELLSPSLMATFGVLTAKDQASVTIQAGTNHVSTVFSEADSEERNQDDKHFTVAPLLFEHPFLSGKPAERFKNICKPIVQCPHAQKSLFALHSLLLI